MGDPITAGNDGGYDVSQGALHIPAWSSCIVEGSYKVSSNVARSRKGERLVLILVICPLANTEDSYEIVEI